MTSREFQERLASSASRAGVVVSGDLAARLQTYYRLLATWNRKINLTGMNLAEGGRDVFDRLLVEPLVAAERCPPFVRQIIDIGSGGGSPAIPFVLALPGRVLLRLVESRGRKCVFLREALRTLEIEGAVEAARYEDLLRRSDLHEVHELLTVRAVRIDPLVLRSLQTFVTRSGQLFLFTGASGGAGSWVPLPPLSWRATYPLIESQRSILVVLEKSGGDPGLTPESTGQ